MPGKSKVGPHIHIAKRDLAGYKGPVKAYLIGAGHRKREKTRALLQGELLPKEAIFLIVPRPGERPIRVHAT